MILLVLSLMLNVVLIYTTFNAERKIEILENAVEYFYTQLQNTLLTIRTLDERQIFEKDDEVGSVFSQIVDSINDLRPLLYGSIEDGENEEKIG